MTEADQESLYTSGSTDDLPMKNRDDALFYDRDNRRFSLSEEITTHDQRLY